MKFRDKSTSTSSSNSKYGAFGSNPGFLTSVKCIEKDGKLSLEYGFVIGGTAESSGKIFTQNMYIPRNDIFWGNESYPETAEAIHKSVLNSVEYTTTLVEQLNSTLYPLLEFDKESVESNFEENWAELNAILGQDNSMFDVTYDKISFEQAYNSCMQKAFVAIEYKAALLLHAIGSAYQKIVSIGNNENMAKYYNENCIKYSVRNSATQEYDEVVGYKIGSGYLFLHYSKGGEYLNPAHPSSLLRVTEYTSKITGNLIVGLYSNINSAQNTVMSKKHDVKNISGNIWNRMLNTNAEKDSFSIGDCRKKTYENLLAIKLFETKA